MLIYEHEESNKIIENISRYCKYFVIMCLCDLSIASIDPMLLYWRNSKIATSITLLKRTYVKYYYTGGHACTGRLYGRTRWSKNMKFIFIARSRVIAISKMFTRTFSASTVLFIWAHPLSPSTSLELHRCCLWTPCINIVSTYRGETRARR